VEVGVEVDRDRDGVAVGVFGLELQWDVVFVEGLVPRP
jgi:hypothetical protein